MISTLVLTFLLGVFRLLPFCSVVGGLCLRLSQNIDVSFLPKGLVLCVGRFDDFYALFFFTNESTTVLIKLFLQTL